MHKFDDRSCIRVRLTSEHTAFVADEAKRMKVSPTLAVEKLFDELVARRGGSHAETDKK
ncbi:hypothetical protein ACVD55_000326 [Vibrio alginolyticus]|uniref:hypothetical protein n=1 Tax=Vibrio harveyi TaxID=669 RepID=UPI003735D966